MIATALWASALLVAAWWRIERLVHERADAERRRQEAAAAVRAQELALEERRLAIEERRVVATLEPEGVPVDLLQRITAETEDWAREQVRTLVTQLYQRHGNWDTVRLELARADAVTLPMGWSQTRSGGWS